MFGPPPCALDSGVSGSIKGMRFKKAGRSYRSRSQGGRSQDGAPLPELGKARIHLNLLVSIDQDPRSEAPFNSL